MPRIVGAARAAPGGVGPGVRELKETAAQQFGAGQYEEAAASYRAAIRGDPKDPLLRLRHADACRRSGQVQVAIVSYQMAAKLFSKAGNVSCARAALNLAVGLSDKPNPVLERELSLLEAPRPPPPPLEAFSASELEFPVGPSEASQPAPSGADPEPITEPVVQLIDEAPSWIR